MEIFSFNAHWMTFNSFLAILAVIFGYFFLRTPNHTLKVIFGVLWLLFLPNTIYLFTDLYHILGQWDRVTFMQSFVLAFQYAFLQVIGVVTFILGFHPFEKIVAYFAVLKRNKIKAIVAFNFLIAFGMVLGRVERVNSWEVFTNPLNVLSSAFHVLTTPQLILLTIMYAFVCNFIYFWTRDFIFHRVKKILRKSSGVATQLLD